MAKDPAFLFYTNDFSSGTQFFSDEQVGKYMRILMAQHQHGHLPEKHVIFICKSYDKDIFSKLRQDPAGLWYNERLEIEIEKRKNYVQSRSGNKKGKTKEKIISKSYDNHMVNENENVIVNSNYILIDGEKYYEILPVLEFYGAALNARQKDFSTIAWRELVPKWFEQNYQMDFSDQKHVLNSFSKFMLNNSRKPAAQASRPNPGKI